jgi:hypothetical protein
MKINRIIFCLNNNPTYTGFWNINARIWSEKYNIKPTLFFVGDYKEFKDLNLSEKIGDVFFLPNANRDLTNGSLRNWTITWSLFYGSTFFPNEVCMLSGIDQIPLGDHIIKLADSYDEDKYLVCWSDAYNNFENLFPSSHHISLGKNFKEIYEISNDWQEEIDKVYSHRVKYNLNQDYWGLDEAYSSELLLKNRTERVVLIKNFFADWSNRRIDFRKNGLNYNVGLLKSNYYSELHAPRPYEDYKKAIDNIILDCHNIEV